jgi:hypothetical protein
MNRVKLLLLLGAVAALGGCRFWYKPVKVANAIGEERTVLATDTVNVHREDRFEVYGPNPEAVYDGYEQLNRASRGFERHFSVPAPRLAVILLGDSARPLDAATARGFRDRGFVVIRYVRSRSFRSPSRYGALAYGGVQWPIAPTAARAMLARFADTQLEADGVRSDTMLLDRFPLWFRAATIHLIGEAGLPSADLEYAREKRALLLPLRDLLTLVRPASADSLLDPSRRSEADETTRVIAAQSSTFARFLVEREGPAVIGRIARDYLAGRTLNDVMGDLKNTPHSFRELEQRWKFWLETRED